MAGRKEKQGGNCIYTLKIKESWKWADPVKNKPHYVKCSLCCSEFSILSGITATLKRHSECVKHKSAEKSKEKTPSISTFLNNSSTVSKFDTEKAVMKAEAIHVIRLVINNESFASSETESSTTGLYGYQFPDSATAKQVHVSKTKATYVATGLAKGIQELNNKELRKSSYFGIGVDESTKADKGKMEFYITYFDSSTTPVPTRKTSFLDTINLEYDKDDVSEALQSRDPEKIRGAINKTLSGATDLVAATELVMERNGLEPKKLLFLMTDNCSTMVGCNEGFTTKMRDICPALVHFDGCGCHHINTVVGKIRKGGFKDTIDNLKHLTSFLGTKGKVTHFLKAAGDIIMFNKLDKEAPTRFLFLCRVICGVCLQWNWIKLFIEGCTDRIDKKKYPTLIEWMRRTTTPIMLDQLYMILHPFNTAMTKLQGREVTILEQRNVLQTLVVSQISRLGLIEKVNHSRTPAQFYHREGTSENFTLMKFTKKKNYMCLSTKTKSVSSSYDTAGKDLLLKVEATVTKAREELLYDLLNEIKPFVTNIVTRNASMPDKIIEKVQQRSLLKLADAINIVDTNDLLEEYNDMVTRYSTSQLKDVLKNTEGKYPNFLKVQYVMDLIIPHNMEVERGFNQTGDILTKKRTSMSHETYRDIKIIKREFPSRKLLKPCLEKIWEELVPYVKAAPKEYTIKVKNDKAKNVLKRQAAEETREVMGLQPIELTPFQAKKKKLELSKDITEAQNRLMSLQKELDHVDDENVRVISLN